MAARKDQTEAYLRFTTGEKKEISHEASMTQQYAYSYLGQGYINDSGVFACRGGFESTVEVPKIDDYHSSFSYSYIDGELCIFQFGALQADSTQGRECFYTTIDIASSTILEENVRFVGSTYYFIPDKFDALSSRTTDNKLVHYIVGGELLQLIEFDGAGLIAVTGTPGNVRHPYAIVKIGGLFAMMCFSADSTQTQLGLTKEEWSDHTPSQKHRLFETSGPTAQVSQAAGNIDDAEVDGVIFFLSTDVQITLGLRANENIYRAAYFADAVFFVSNKGLTGIIFPDDFDNIGTQTKQRALSTFEGVNVTPVSLNANFLFYCGDEIRFRDISRADIQVDFVGDYVALPSSRTYDYIGSTYLPDKDALLFLEEGGLVKAVMQGQGKIGTQTTTFLDCDCYNITHITNTQNKLYAISTNATTLSALVYDPLSGVDISNTGTSQIKHKITFPFYPRSFGQHTCKAYFDMQGAAFTDTPGKNVLFSKGDRAVLSLDLNLSDEFYAGGANFEFTTDTPVLINALVVGSSAG